MKKSDCEICKHWAASQSDDFPCDECDNGSRFEYPEEDSGAGYQDDKLK
jgi:hypothetical protein